MATAELKAEPRTAFGKKFKPLRRVGKIPANIFGHGDSFAIQAEEREVERFLAGGGITGVMSIALDGDTRTALLRNVSRDPRSGKLLHLDFQGVSMSQRVTATVPLHYVGDAPAARLGAIILFPATEVHVEALARDIPETIEVDLTRLEQVGGTLTVADLKLGQKVTVTDSPDHVIAQAQAPRVAQEEVAEAQEQAIDQAVAEATEEAAASTEASPEPATEEPAS